MACVSHAVNQSLEYAYAHHIQRLMITGNFALLAGVDPEEVDHLVHPPSQLLFAEAVKTPEVRNELPRREALVEPHRRGQEGQF